MQDFDHQISEYDQNYLHLIICFSKSYLEPACAVACKPQLFNFWTAHACKYSMGYFSTTVWIFQDWGKLMEQFIKCYFSFIFAFLPAFI